MIKCYQKSLALEPDHFETTKKYRKVRYIIHTNMTAKTSPSETRRVKLSHVCSRPHSPETHCVLNSSDEEVTGLACRHLKTRKSTSPADVQNTSRCSCYETKHTSSEEGFLVITSFSLSLLLEPAKTALTPILFAKELATVVQRRKNAILRENTSRWQYDWLSDHYCDVI